MTTTGDTTKTTAHTIANLRELEDMAARYGYGELGSARFARRDLDAADTGLSLHNLLPGKRSAFGHRHERAEEVYIVLSGSGRIALDDDVIDVRAFDAIRIAPGVARALEAGPDGMEWLAVGPYVDGDAELLSGWWPS
jgi:mannose-6-phosphate isomerase-like protein (cupin superfamily)